LEVVGSEVWRACGRVVRFTYITPRDAAVVWSPVRLISLYVDDRERWFTNVLLMPL